MANEHPGSALAARWPTGITTLIGILIGALGGLAFYTVPFGMVAGLAAGVGIDSLLNHWRNEIADAPGSRAIDGPSDTEPRASVPGESDDQRPI
jgi:hypothetical protein